ncbi:bis(5'-nucleosyl)-tetraphosphatase (symmetrical) YqeK [Paenibacillus silvae]|uniref:bis(5'-nucleosyl)-tetraphosphatase (symmetrical) n=1 Tax=Paenibacillus silvae TaxID=1325358 RepID=A0ABQ1Z2W8_9BACL|nr:MULTISPECIES: bis(5'-nucleosyl)-tetraphosphatase (symmetrical) YqeK [Paenibacillus]MCK6075347.1 bis(5'-nucleosyl)-tetraphosphatase (symmetrical) YqeK [Paenibacillus silvae]MCK6149734.1 bis(5'-nucleosyl)-tetraphosphatase (symmetrical) YqeK [Paenibacillus silvae]MCK6268032.1 bis(5'-nucleosyl)-tetraphosphatase (symmetrical) YqeK [Paenibacillus silvae]GGH45443.1 HD domain-containing protein [Paenibacillus silvae]
MALSREELIQAVSSQMPAKRWKHTQGVMESAVILAEKYGADPVKADIAAILHDVAKYWPVAEMEAVIRDNGLNAELLSHDKQLWHSEVGAFVAERDYGVSDSEIINAIRWHTSGRVGMSLLDKVVCLADYIEPGRDFPGVEHIREQAQRSLEEGLIAGFDSTISLLLSQRRVIYPLTVLSRNDLIAQLHN